MEATDVAPQHITSVEKEASNSLRVLQRRREDIANSNTRAIVAGTYPADGKSAPDHLRAAAFTPYHTRQDLWLFFSDNSDTGELTVIILQATDS